MFEYCHSSGFTAGCTQNRIALQYMLDVSKIKFFTSSPSLKLKLIWQIDTL